MFTGIIEGTGQLVGHVKKGDFLQIVIQPCFPTNALRLGESVAVNGCCLTVAKKTTNHFWTDLSPETIEKTNLARQAPGAEVNLERSLRLQDRLGGHWVQGHVDGLGQIRSIKKRGSFLIFEIQFPKELRRYLVPKGSICIDGISLTVTTLKRDQFSLVVVPHTLAHTNLGKKKRGDLVNLEVDIIGKYVESLLLRRKKR